MDKNTTAREYYNKIINPDTMRDQAIHETIIKLMEDYSRERVEALVNMDQLALAEQIWDEIGSTGNMGYYEALEKYNSLKGKL